MCNTEFGNGCSKIGITKVIWLGGGQVQKGR